MLNVSLSDLAMHSIDKCAGNNTNSQRLFVLGHSQITLAAGNQLNPKNTGSGSKFKADGLVLGPGLKI